VSRALRPLAVLVAILALGLQGIAHAQLELDPRRPAEDRPEVPSFLPSRPEPGIILPPLETRAAATPARGASLATPSVFVGEIRILGNTVLPPALLSGLASPYVGRSASFEELLDLRDQLTLCYARNGYLTSGALLPTRAPDGAIEFQIIEGALGSLSIETDGRLRQRYLRERLALAAEGPVNVYRLEERLQLMQQEPSIRSVRAELAPGSERGASRLHLQVFEERAAHASLEIDDGVSPSLGDWRGVARIEHANLTGFADHLSLEHERSDGLRAFGARYVVPISARDTLLELRVRSSASDVVEDPFEDLEIEGRAATYAVTLRQPIHRSLGETLNRVELSLGAEYRRSKSFLFGRAFSFSDGVEDGEAEVAVVRFGQDWTRASRAQVLAARSTLSFGVDAFGATRSRDRGVPDGKFVSWLAQVQWARRLGLPLGGETPLEAQLLVRADLQLSNEPLLGLEQFAIGGRTTVRGYRDSEIVRDNGALFSVELSVPLWRRPDGSEVLSLAPFFDVGRSWSSDRPTRGPSTLAGAGFSLRASLGSRLSVEVGWADDLREIEREGREDERIERGLHFRVVARY
jgi:hemolysin activation/secretion protein